MTTTLLPCTLEPLNPCTLEPSAEPLLPSLPNFIPIPHLTLILGDPGVGKSLLAIDLATRLSNNAAPPPHPPAPRQISPHQIPDDANSTDYQPATAIILSTEDSDDTLKLRLITAGAHFPRISLPNSDLSLIPPLPRDFKLPFSRTQPQPAPLIEWLIFNLKTLHNPRLLILDSLPSFLGSKDCSNPATIRRLLHPLLRLAENRHFAILGLSHLTKSLRKNQHPLHRSFGSLAYPALARSILLLTPDPTHPNRRLLTQIKNNLAPLTPPLSFTLTTSPSTATVTERQSPTPNIGTLPAQAAHSPHLTWNPSPLSPTPYPLPPHPPLPDPFTQSQLDLAQKFLLESLTPGPLPSSQLLKQARSLGLSQRTLARAKFHLQVLSYRDLPTSQWLCSLPPNPPN